MARSSISPDAPAHRRIREAAELLATHPKKTGHEATEAVMVASVLAQNDAATTGKLHPATRFALDRIWTFQREDGGWNWFDGNEPPSEIDDHFGVTMAAIGVGSAPEDYASTPPARKGLERIRGYFRKNPPANLHHRGMKLLASLRVEGILTEAERSKTIEDLLAAQRPDGGWGLASLGRNWKRSDGKPQDYESSDGYGTGFVIYVLRAAGVPAGDPRIRGGIGWLKSHQRVSGRWFTRSLNRDGHHLLTNSGTAYAILALTSCGENPAGDPEPASVRLTVLNSMERIGQDQEPRGEAGAEIQAARNEWESFQVVVSARGESCRVTRAELSDLAGPGGAKIGGDSIRLYRQEYVRVRLSSPRAELPPGLYPDPLVPFINPQTGKPIEPRRVSQARWGERTAIQGHDMYALPFEVFRGQNQPLWIDVHVPEDAPAGDYAGTFRIRTGRGKTAEIPVRLTVWDFTLPDGPTHRNHFGSFRNIARYFEVQPGSERFRTIELRYCRAMAEHRLNPPIPGHLLPEVERDGSLRITPERDEALKKFMREFHARDFEIPRAPFARLRVSASRPDYKDVSPQEREKALRYYRDYRDYVKRNGWAERAYVYLWDEPNLRENYEQVLVLGKLVHEAAPELKCLVVEQTYPHDSSWPDLDPAVDIWCPLWSFIDRESIREKIEGGDEVWSYTALSQRSPRYHPDYDRVKGLDPPYWHIDQPLLVYRIPPWINRQYGITGLLYWTTVTTVLHPWTNPAFSHPRHYNGGGYLFYPGVPCGIDGPLPCIRLKNLRDGMEDYEYFALLERASGSGAVQKIVDRIAPSWWGYTRDPGQILSARRELAGEIVRAAGSR